MHTTTICNNKKSSDDTVVRFKRSVQPNHHSIRYSIDGQASNTMEPTEMKMCRVRLNKESDIINCASKNDFNAPYRNLYRCTTMTHCTLPCTSQAKRNVAQVTEAWLHAFASQNRSAVVLPGF